MVNMLQEVHQTFVNLGEKYPEIKLDLEKCYKNIQTKYVEQPINRKQDRKEKIQSLSTKFMNMTLLQTSYDGLENEIAHSKVTLIELLKQLPEAIASYNKKVTTLASRQGILLEDAKKALLPQDLKQVREVWEFSIRCTNFLISLHKLMKEYPRPCHCAVSIRTFMINMKVIREICEDNAVFWNNI